MRVWRAGGGGGDNEARTAATAASGPGRGCRLENTPGWWIDGAVNMPMKQHIMHAQSCPGPRLCRGLLWSVRRCADLSSRLLSIGAYATNLYLQICNTWTAYGLLSLFRLVGQAERRHIFNVTIPSGNTPPSTRDYLSVVVEGKKKWGRGAEACNAAAGEGAGPAMRG